MATFHCLNDDDGVCVYPERVLVANNGLLSVVSAEVANEIVPVEDAVNRAEEQEGVLEGIGYDQLVDLLLLRLLRTSPNRPEPDLYPDVEIDVDLSGMKRLLNGRSGLIANCSCGHQFFVPA